MFTLTLALIYYMNFKYGWSQAPELGDNVQREVRDRDYFYIWSYSAWGVWAAIGLVYIWQQIAAADRSETSEKHDKARLRKSARPGCSRRRLLLACPSC